MKIPENLDVKRIARAKGKVFLVILLLSFVALVIWFPTFRAFAVKHPGLMGVLVAVSGEVYFDWNEEAGRNAKWKRFFMALLVVSLAYELYEASESDKEAAKATKLAGLANERASSNEEHVAQLQLQIENASNTVAQADEKVSEEGLQVEELKSNNLAFAKDILQLAAFVNESNTTARIEEEHAAISEASNAVSAVKSVLGNSNLETVQGELAQIKEKVGQRHLTDGQKASIAYFLDEYQVPRGKIRFNNMAIGDDEAVAYEKELTDFFKYLGFDAERGSGLMFEMPPFKGIAIGIKTEDQAPVFAAPLQRAFSLAGIELPGFTNSDLANSDTVEIRIGIKPQL